MQIHSILPRQKKKSKIAQNAPRIFRKEFVIIDFATRASPMSARYSHGNLVTKQLNVTKIRPSHFLAAALLLRSYYVPNVTLDTRENDVCDARV